MWHRSECDAVIFVGSLEKFCARFEFYNVACEMIRG